MILANERNHDVLDSELDFNPEKILKREVSDTKFLHEGMPLDHIYRILAESRFRKKWSCDVLHLGSSTLL